MCPRSPRVLRLLSSALRGGRMQVAAPTQSQVRASRAALPDGASDTPGFVRAGPRSCLHFHFAQNGVQSQGMAAGQPRSPGPELCRGPQDHSAGRAGLSPCFSCWGSQPSALWPLQDIQTPTGFAPPCLCASQHLAQKEAAPLCPLRGTGGAPRAHVAHLTPGDKALSGSDLQPALRARQSPSPGPLRSQTGKLKAPRSWT